MKVLVKAARILNQGSAHHLKTKDILIENGTISKIGDHIELEGAEVIEGENLVLSAGLFDAYSVIREPGNEHKDDLQNLINSAAKGGFTDVLGISGSDPSLEKKAQVIYVKGQTAGAIVDVHPIGTITEKQEGKNITELYDLHLAGVLAFSDGKRSIKNPELLKRALLYVKPFGGKLMVYSEDEDLANAGMVNEGAVAANLGMKVRPALAEEIVVQRNIELATYTGTALHLQAISSKKSIALPKAAKESGLAITADVQLANLLFSDDELAGFDTNYKVLPVLRSEEDRKALVAAVKEGIIDFISSGHTPQDGESKECEFDHAAFGMTSLETAVASLVNKGDFTLEEAVELMGNKVRSFLDVQSVKVEEGSLAKLTVFQEGKGNVAKSEVKGIAKNNPMLDKDLPLQVKAIVSNGQVQLN